MQDSDKNDKYKYILKLSNKYKVVNYNISNN
jgi:hypothetical protein